MQGECRCWKIPRCHHHNQFTHIIAYIVLLVDDAENGRLLPSTFQWQIFISRSREYLPRYIVYRAVLPFTQLREVSYRSQMRGGSRCWTYKYPIATTAPTTNPNLNMMIITFRMPPLSMTPKTDDPPGEHHTWMHLRDHPKSRTHIFLVPHNAWQWWSRELASLEELFVSQK